MEYGINMAHSSPGILNILSGVSIYFFIESIRIFNTSSPVFAPYFSLISLKLSTPTSIRKPDAFLVLAYSLYTFSRTISL